MRPPTARLMPEPEELLPAATSGLRTCLACGAKKNKRSLLRFVGLDGTLVFDEAQRLPGRGAYCCRLSACLGKFGGRKRRASAVLRQELTDYRALAALREKSWDRPGELAPGD